MFIKIKLAAPAAQRRAPSCAAWSALLPHLLLVFSLRVKAGLNAFSGLLEGLSLRAFCWVVCTHSDYVGAGEDQHIGHKL